MNLNYNNKIFQKKLLLWLMLATPFIDLLNGFFEFELRINISPGVIIRTIILLFILYMYIKVDKSNLLKLLFIISIFLIQLLILNFTQKVNLFSDISFISKIYYNIFLIFISGKVLKDEYENYDTYIDTLANVGVIVSISLLITKTIGVGVSSYGEAGGYKGLYMGTNDLTAVFIMTFPFMLYKLIKGNNKLVFPILVILSGLNIIMIGTKTAIVFLIIITLFFIYNTVFKKFSIKGLIIILGSIIIFTFIFKHFMWDIFKSSIIERQIYFIKQTDILSYLLSGRNLTMMRCMEYFSSNLFFIFFGTGFTVGSNFIGSFLTGHGMIEMDLLDILYFYGIIIFSIVFIPIIKCFIKGIKVLINNGNLKYRLIALVYIIIVVISFLGGHVLLSPLAGIYFAILYGMLKNI